MLLLISFLSFLLPFQLAVHLDFFQSSVYGFKIDYLIPTIYLTDIVVFLIVALKIKNLRFIPNLFRTYRKYFIVAILYTVIVFINVNNSINEGASIYRWIKLTEMILLGIVIYNTKKFKSFNNFIKPLSYSVYLVCILGILQYLLKGSVGGLFYWIGERSFNFNDSNIAPYPYGSFSHPNSFSGFLLVFLIFFLNFKNKFNTKYFWSLIVLVLLNLFLTNSLNVYVTVAFLLFLKFKKFSMFAILPINFGQRFITHRIELIEASFKMINSHFLFGVGLNNFIPNLVLVSNTFINSWELQPVHNIFLLLLSEIGFIGTSFLMYIVTSGFTSINTNYQLLAIIITGMSDHYWLTLQQNLLLLTYVVVISKKKK